MRLRPEGRPPTLRFRPPAVHIPLWVMAVGWVLALTGRGCRWAAVHWRTTVVAACAGWLLLTDTWLWALVAGCLLAGGLCVWWAMWPGSFARRVSRPVTARWRELVTYRRMWQPAMLTAGLTLREAWGGDLPTLRRVRAAEGGDVLRVRMLPGQTLEQWRAATPQLAQTFGKRSIRVRRVNRRLQELDLFVPLRTAPAAVPLRHVTEPAPEVETLELPAARGAFPRQARGTS